MSESVGEGGRGMAKERARTCAKRRCLSPSASSMLVGAAASPAARPSASQCVQPLVWHACRGLPSRLLVAGRGRGTGKLAFALSSPPAHLCLASPEPRSSRSVTVKDAFSLWRVRGLWERCNCLGRHAALWEQSTAWVCTPSRSI